RRIPPAPARAGVLDRERLRVGGAAARQARQGVRADAVGVPGRRSGGDLPATRLGGAVLRGRHPRARRPHRRRSGTDGLGLPARRGAGRAAALRRRPARLLVRRDPPRHARQRPGARRGAVSAAARTAGAGLDALAARVRALEDAEAIRALKARYAELVDARYGPDGPLAPERLAPLADAIAELFTEDAVWDGGPALGRHEGRAASRARMAAPTLRGSRHWFASPRIEVVGDRGSARWELLARCTLRDGRRAWMAGVEHDGYARRGERWLHTRTTLTLHFLDLD